MTKLNVGRLNVGGRNVGGDNVGWRKRRVEIMSDRENVGEKMSAVKMLGDQI